MHVSYLWVKTTLSNQGTVEVLGCAGLVLEADLVNTGTLTGSGCVLASGAGGKVINDTGATLVPTDTLRFYVPIENRTTVTVPQGKTVVIDGGASFFT